VSGVLDSLMEKINKRTQKEGRENYYATEPEECAPKDHAQKYRRSKYHNSKNNDAS
jgi:hypothetical protein